ncbi:hypothetical protein BCV70DRAFT_3188 [Testicularia cyperi]|uniref:DUF3295 domain-containing protein n=1 Tax=Testicularia cyperi TaxID=1882483 RepID=A0A317XWE9_9BASI|nr:hypothetical protein BCV70DRAFT_3188 [Testicularia cyperi]
MVTSKETASQTNGASSHSGTSATGAEAGPSTLYHGSPLEHGSPQHQFRSMGMTRTESASSTATEASQRSSTGRKSNEAKPKTRAASSGLHAGHRSKSATSLHRTGKHSKSSERIANMSAARTAPRHNLLSGLAMTRAAPEAAPSGVSRKPVPPLHPPQEHQPSSPAASKKLQLSPTAAPSKPEKSALAVASTNASAASAKASSSSTKNVRTSAAGAGGTRKAPVKFTMGADDSESDDGFEDESDIENTAPLHVQQPATSSVVSRPAQGPAGHVHATHTQDDGFVDEEEQGDDDDWASDSEAEELEERARQAAEAERRRREEEERHRAMFQKRPIRSKSAADVRLLAPSDFAPSGPSPPMQPPRGLLSSLFHPDEQHSPPGQLMGRPHASAADLRANPSLAKKGVAVAGAVSGAGHSPPTTRRNRTHRDSADSGAAPFSFRESGFAGIGGLKTSKSAVALPLLDTHATESSTAAKHRHSTHSQQSDATATSGGHRSEASAHISSPESPVNNTSMGGRPSSIALARLHALTNMRSHAQRGSSSNVAGTSDGARYRASASETDAGLDHENLSRSLRLEVSPDDRDFAIPSRASTTNLASAQRKLSAPTLATRHSDQIETQQQQQRREQSRQHREDLGSGSRSNSEGLPSGHNSPYSGSQPSNSHAPISIARTRSALNLPDAAAPQTPRTTRRNMLRDELSESLRQNLLWERQSRSRMMGIGALGPVTSTATNNHNSNSNSNTTTTTQQQYQQHQTNQTPAPQRNRRDNVLNGSMLRPLTSTGTSSPHKQPEYKPKRYSEEWGSFHHKGW